MSNFASEVIMRSTLGSQSRDSTPLLAHQRGVYSGPYKRPPWYRDTMFYMNLVRRGLAELVATGLFVFVSVSVMSNTDDDYYYSIPSSSATLSGLASGLSFASLMAATMHVR